MIDTLHSSYSVGGKNATYTLVISFPSTFTGIHSISASAPGAGATAATPYQARTVTVPGKGIKVKDLTFTLMPLR